MDLLHPGSHSENLIDVSKVDGPSWLFVLVNVVQGLKQFIDWSLPQRSRAQDNLEGFHVTIWQVCVSVYTMLGGFLRLHLEILYPSIVRLLVITITCLINPDQTK